MMIPKTKSTKPMKHKRMMLPGELVVLMLLPELTLSFLLRRLLITLTFPLGELHLLSGKLKETILAFLDPCGECGKRGLSGT